MGLRNICCPPSPPAGSVTLAESPSLPSPTAAVLPPISPQPPVLSSLSPHPWARGLRARPNSSGMSSIFLRREQDLGEPSRLRGCRRVPPGALEWASGVWWGEMHPKSRKGLPGCCWGSLGTGELDMCPCVGTACARSRHGTHTWCLWGSLEVGGTWGIRVPLGAPVELETAMRVQMVPAACSPPCSLLPTLSRQPDPPLGALAVRCQGWKDGVHAGAGVRSCAPSPPVPRGQVSSLAFHSLKPQCCLQGDCGAQGATSRGRA